MPEAPLYIVVAIFVAIAAMTAADLRERNELLPSSTVAKLVKVLTLGSWVSTFHVIVLVIIKNDLSLGVIVHLISLNAILVAQAIWYVSMAKDRGFDRWSD